jgi:hypothetical protein
MRVFPRFAPILALAAALAAASALTGCATSRETGWQDRQTSVSMTDAEVKRAQAEADAGWAKRDDRSSLLAALQTLEKLAGARPQDTANLTRLARGFYLLADGHTTEVQEKKRLWEVGASWGERALAVNPAFRKLVVDEKKPVEDALGAVTKDQVAALYWSAVNLGKWAKHSSLGTQLKYKGRIRKMIERVGELEPDFFHGAVPRYWGTFYAVAPGIAGGDMNKAWEKYQESVAKAPQYLETRVLIAENYAVKKEDRKLFRSELEAVLKADPKVAELAPENTIAKRKAKDMLARIEEMF